MVSHHNVFLVSFYTLSFFRLLGREFPSQLLQPRRPFFTPQIPSVQPLYSPCPPQSALIVIDHSYRAVQYATSPSTSSAASLSSELRRSLQPPCPLSFGVLCNIFFLCSYRPIRWVLIVLCIQLQRPLQTARYYRQCYQNFPIGFIM